MLLRAAEFVVVAYTRRRRRIILLETHGATSVRFARGVAIWIHGRSARGGNATACEILVTETR